MDNRRLILVVALGFVLISLWQAWTRDQSQSAQQAAATTQNAAIPGSPAESTAAKDIPATPAPTASGQTQGAVTGTPEAKSSASNKA
ncbi:MAG: hypothetical protein IE913_08910, partial [Halothiobacillus sp.]|nr:hypothetical protein [Halothiobacillus sp.]